MHKDLDVRRFLFAVSLILLGISMLTHRLPAQTMPTRFTIVDEGTEGKPDVVLIPGLSSSRSVWDGEAKLLAPNYRLHLVQVNGFGGQSAGPNATGAMLPAITEELHSYIAMKKLHPIVIGHSLGGLLAMMLADRHQADVAKLVIVDSLPFYPLAMSLDATLDNTRPQVEAIRERMSGLPDDQYAAMQPMMAAALVKDTAGQKSVAASSATSDRAVVLNAMLEDMQTDLRPDLASIRTPTLMLYPFEAGTRQGNEPAKVDALYASAFKIMSNVTLKRIDNSRHFIMYDQPATFNAELQAFLR
ncbi:MAG: alpha/beta fold hydrolase [Janthinobacterium lividum]